MGVTFGSGNAGSVSVDVAGGISIDGTSSTVLAGIGSDAEPGSSGNGGVVSVSAGALSIANTGEISSSAFATGSGGNVTVRVADRLSISGPPDNSIPVSLLMRTLLGGTAGMPDRSL